MERFRQRARFLLTIALVLGLHLTIISLLVATTRRTTTGGTSEAIEIVFYPLPTPSNESKPTVRRAESAAVVRQGKHNAPARADLSPRSSEQGGTPASVDWANELTRAARDAVPEGSTQNSRDFGFPHRPAASASNPPQFGWDYAATHRIESIPEGGLLVHLNDNCVLVLFPLPFVGCGIGKRKANAHLFDHMHDSSQPADENQPK
jgi:hypothetical protein